MPQFISRQVLLPTSTRAPGQSTPAVTEQTDPQVDGTENEQQTADTAAAAEHQFLTDIWASSDDGSLSALQGITGAVTSAVSLLMAILSLLPVYTFAPAYMQWHKTPVDSVSTFVMVFESALPDLYQQVRCVGTLCGVECREALHAATANMFGTFSGAPGIGIHSAFVYAVMIFIWATDDSPHAAQIFTLLFQYMSLEHSELSSFETLAGLRTRSTLRRSRVARST